MKEVAPSGLDLQPQHQIIYVKNLIASIIGLPHQIQLDLHTGVINDELLGKSREEILAIFYKHFTPTLLVNSLREKIQQQLEIIQREVDLQDPDTLPEPEQWTDSYWKQKVEKEQANALERQLKGLPPLTNRHAGKSWEVRKEEYIKATVKEAWEEEHLGAGTWKFLAKTKRRDKRAEVLSKIKKTALFNKKIAEITNLFKDIPCSHPLWEVDPVTGALLGLTKEGALAVLCASGCMSESA